MPRLNATPQPKYVIKAGYAERIIEALRNLDYRVTEYSQLAGVTFRTEACHDKVRIVLRDGTSITIRTRMGGGDHLITEATDGQ